MANQTYDGLDRPYDRLIRRSKPTDSSATTSFLGEDSAQRSQETSANLLNAKQIEVSTSVSSANASHGDTGFILDAEDGSLQTTGIEIVAPSPDTPDFYNEIVLSSSGELSWNNIFWSPGTTSPNGIQSGNKGDICITGDVPYACDGGTVWYSLKPTTGYGSVYVNSDVTQTLTNASQDYTLLFNTNGLSAGGPTSDAGNYRVNCPAGTYHIHANVSLYTDRTAYIDFAARISNSVQSAIRATTNYPSANETRTLSINGIVTLASSSTINCRLLTPDAGTVVTIKWANLTVTKL